MSPMQPGSFAAKMPAGEDALIRKIQEIERTMREFLPSVAESFGPVVADLQAQDATLQAQQATLTAQQATLTAQVADLASRVSVTSAGATFNTGSLPDDSTWHTYGSGIPITIAVPTGRIIVTVGCGQATIATGAGAVTAEATFSLSDGSVNFGDVYARGYASAPIVASGASLSVQRAFAVTPGTYTITGQMRAWASGSTTGSVEFARSYLTVQVTG